MEFNRMVDAAVFKAIPQQPQSQAATNDQVAALMIIANKFGLYDAADSLRRSLCASGNWAK